MRISRVSTCLTAVAAALAIVTPAAPAHALDAPGLGLGVVVHATPPDDDDPVCTYYAAQPKYNTSGEVWYGDGRATCVREIEDIHLHVRIYCYDSAEDETGTDCGASLGDVHQPQDAYSVSYYRPTGTDGSWARTHVAVTFTFSGPAPELPGWCRQLNTYQVACYDRSIPENMRDITQGS